LGEDGAIWNSRVTEEGQEKEFFTDMSKKLISTVKKYDKQADWSELLILVNGTPETLMLKID
jgi:hypothetical protein